MKYRVIEENGVFEPQVRILFTWHTMTEGYWNIKIWCNSLEEARGYIEKHKAEREDKPTKVVYSE